MNVSKIQVKAFKKLEQLQNPNSPSHSLDRKKIQKNRPVGAIDSPLEKRNGKEKGKKKNQSRGMGTVHGVCHGVHGQSGA